jgi:flagellin-like hook-associated protein FlgL
MISGVSTTTLSQIYKKQTNDYTKVLETIAGGAKFNKPSDDFVAYTRTRMEESSLKGYQRINEDLVKAKEVGTQAASLGNSAFEGLSELKELAKSYASTTDQSDKDILKEKFDAAAKAISDSFANNTYEGSALNGVSVQIDPSQSTSTMTLTLTDPTSTLASGTLDITDSTKIDAALKAVAKYTAEAEGFNSAIDRQMTINQNIMAAKENTISAVRDIDDIAAIGKATALEIRQQASISMIAQANIAQTSLVRLFS